MYYDPVGLIRSWFNIWNQQNVNKGQSDLIISIDTETAFDKIQHLAIAKAINKLGNKVNFINIIKDIYKTFSHMCII